MSGDRRTDDSSSPRDYRGPDGSWRPSRAEGLARVLAKAGYGARPRTEALIRAGRVQVDGNVEVDPGRAVDRTHEIRLDGTILREALRRYVVLHKPVGVDCQERKHAGRWIGDYLPTDAMGLEPVGRLDTRARGLLLVSNDLSWNAAIAQDQSLERRYEVVVSGNVSHLVLDVLRSGLNLTSHGVFKPQRVEVMGTEMGRTRIQLHMRGGHQRQVRTAFTMLHHDVLSTVRSGLGTVDLDDLAAGAARDLNQGEITRLAKPCRKSAS